MQVDVIRSQARKTVGEIDGTTRSSQSAGADACCDSVLLATCCDSAEREICCGAGHALERGAAPRSCGCQDSTVAGAMA